jgi:hypothetical protein
MLTFRTTLLSLVVALAANGFTLPIYAKTLVVNSNADATDPNNKLTLRAAIAQAASGDTINFESSLNGNSILLNPSSGSLVINSDLTISAAQLPSGITINGNSQAGGSSPVFQISFGNVTLDALTITGASSAASAAVCSNSSGNVSISKCKIINNQTVGVMAGSSQTPASSVSIASTTVSNNTAGGLVVSANSCNVNKSDISNNTSASTAGGFAFSGSQLTMSSTKLSANSSTQNGDGALALFGLGNNSSMTIDSSSFENNSAANGAAALGIHGNMFASVTDSNISTNSSPSSSAAAVQNAGGNLTLSRDTLSNNQAIAVLTTSGTTALNNCTLSSNGTQFVADAVVNQGATVTASHTNIEKTSGNGFLNQGTTTLAHCKLLSNGKTGICNLDPVGTSQFTSCLIESNGFKGSDQSPDVPQQTVGVWNQFVSQSSSSVQFTKCGIYKNYHGGVAIYAPTLPGGGTVTFTDCSSSENSGSGLWISGNSTVNVGTSTINKNTSQMNGGGVCINQPASVQAAGAVTFTRSTVSRNVSEGHGGGIYIRVARGVSGATATFNTCTISANNAATSGGGAYVASRTSPLTVNFIGSTLADNISGQALEPSRLGGDLFIVPSPVSVVTLDSCLVARGGPAYVPVPIAGAEIKGSIVSKGYNLVEIMDGSSGYVSTDQTGNVAALLHPSLGPLANNGGPTETQALGSSSPAIHRGDPALAGTVDQRGVKRPRSPDVGAFQTQ